MGLKVSKEVVWEKLQDEVVILDLASGSYLGLDPVGSHIWQMIDQGGSTDTVVCAMLDEFEVDEAVLRRDVEEFVTLLCEKGLLVYAS